MIDTVKPDVNRALGLLEGAVPGSNWIEKNGIAYLLIPVHTVESVFEALGKPTEITGAK